MASARSEPRSQSTGLGCRGPGGPTWPRKQHARRRKPPLAALEDGEGPLIRLYGVLFVQSFWVCTLNGLANSESTILETPSLRNLLWMVAKSTNAPFLRNPGTSHSIPQNKYQHTLWFQPWFQSGVGFRPSIRSISSINASALRPAKRTLKQRLATPKAMCETTKRGNNKTPAE